MDLTLSWDLFVIVFFGIVISYSYIIGKHESVKVIVFSYIAIVAGQGIGNLLERLSTESAPMLAELGLTIDITILGSTKLVIFIATIVFLSVRGGFDVEYKNEAGSATNIALTGLFGFATAGLLLSTLLTFIGGMPLLSSTPELAASLSPIVEQSRLMRVMIIYQDAWFSAPALLLIAVGLIGNKD